MALSTRATLAPPLLELWSEMARLSGLFVCPVQSCAGIALDEGEVDDLGLRWDRRWMVVNEAGLFLSQKDRRFKGGH